MDKPGARGTGRTASSRACPHERHPPSFFLSIYEPVGRGTHSTVYKARKKKSVEYVAVASVDKARRARVLRAVRAMHALAHPNVVAFHAWYETSNHLWLVLEYAAGGSVAALVAADGALPEASAADVGAGAAAGLAALHAAGALHCDFKPAHILLDEVGVAKVAGLGLATRPGRSGRRDEGAPPPSLARPRTGSPAYMAPELFLPGACPPPPPTCTRWGACCTSC